MQTFAEFITPLRIDQLPLIVVMLARSRKGMKALTTFVANVEQAMGETWFVPKPLVTALQNSYYEVTRAVGEAIAAKYPETVTLPVPEATELHDGKHAWQYQTIYQQARRNYIRAQFPSHFAEPGPFTNPFVALGPDWAAIANSYAEMHADYVRVMAEYKLMVDAFNKIVTLVDSPTRRKAKAQYEAPAATKDARALIRRVMIQMTGQIIEQYAEDLASQWTAALTEFFAKNDEERRQHLGIDAASEEARRLKNSQRRGQGFTSQPREPHYIESLLSLVSGVTKSTDGLIFAPHNNWQAAILKQAQQQAKNMQEQFVEKNVDKLAAIVETKGNLEGDPTILRITTDRASVTGELRFHFTDGSQFVVRNKVVTQYRYSSSGLSAYYQFPTTFHDAILPGGHRMPGMPSEEQMNKVFATTKG